MAGNEQISLNRGDKIRTVNGVSGEVGYLQVAAIFGSRFFMRRIREVDVGFDSITMTGWPGTYGPPEWQPDFRHHPPITSLDLP